MTANERSYCRAMHEISDTYRQPYVLAAEHVNGKVCLDTGCGIGLLTNFMGTTAKGMIGIDYDKETIEFAIQNYSDHAIYQCMDCRELKFNDHMFDVVLSFEFIEHLNEEDQHKYLREVVRVLKPDGVVYLSTPNKKSTDDFVHARNQHENEWHLREMYADELCELLVQYFDNIQFLRTEPYFICELRL